MTSDAWQKGDERSIIVASVAGNSVVYIDELAGVVRNMPALAMSHGICTWDDMIVTTAFMGNNMEFFDLEGNMVRHIDTAVNYAGFVRIGNYFYCVETGTQSLIVLDFYNNTLNTINLGHPVYDISRYNDMIMITDGANALLYFYDMEFNFLYNFGLRPGARGVCRYHDMIVISHPFLSAIDYYSIRGVLLRTQALDFSPYSIHSRYNYHE